MRYFKILILFIIFFCVFPNFIKLNNLIFSNQKTTNRFDRDYVWVEKNNGIYGGEIFGLEIDPNNPNIVYVGCHRGLYKSIDGGKNWSKVDMGTDVAYIKTVAIDPNNSDVIYVGGINLLYKTNDGSKTWEYIKGNLDTGWVFSISINKKNSSYVYIASQRGCYKSSDGGKNWITLLKYDDFSSSFNSVESDPINPDIIFVSVDNIGIYKSVDGGINWKNVYKEGFCCFRNVKINPKNNNIIYALGPSGIVISNDGGETWNISNSGLTDWGTWDIDFDPNNPSTIYVCAQTNGIFKSIDSGKNWMNISNNLMNTAVYRIRVNPINSKNIIIATREGIYQTIDSGNNWFYSNNGIDNIVITKILIDQNNPNIMYAAGTGLFKSTDKGNTWQRIDNNIVKNIVNDFTIDKYNSNIIYFAYANQIYKSQDGGKTWTFTNPNHQDLHIGAIEIHPLDPNIVFYSANEKLYRSTNGGKTWEFYSNISEETDWSCDITIDSKDSNIMYICRHGYIPLYKSTDGGRTWKNITKNEINCAGKNLLIDPNDSNILYLTTWGDLIYKSFDGGNNWVKKSKNIYSCCTYNLSINPNNSNELLATVHLSGTYYSNNGGESWSLLRNTNLSSYDCAWVEAIWEPKLEIFIGTYGGGVYKLVFKPTPPLITKIEENFNGIKIEWDKSKEGSNPISGYEIYRSEGTGKYEIISKVGSDKNTFIDRDIFPGKTYYYYIKTYDNETSPVYSDLSNIVSIKTKDSNIILRNFELGEELKNITKILPIGKDEYYISSDKCLYKINFIDNIPQIKEKFFDGKNVSDFYIYENMFLSLVEGKIYFYNNKELKELKHSNKIELSHLTSSKDLSTIYFIDIENNLYKSSNQGNTFSFISNLNPIKDIQFIFLEPNNPNILFIGSKNCFYKSIDGGKSFYEPDPKLKNISITSITYNPYNSNELFLSTWGDNIYFSNNSGESWEIFGDKETKLFINKITPHLEIPYLLYASTQNGLYIVDRYEYRKIFESENPINYSLLFEDKLLFTTFNEGLFSYIKIKESNIKNDIKLKFESVDSDNIKLIWDKIEEENIMGYMILFGETDTKEKFIPIDYLNKEVNYKNIKLSDFKSDNLYFSLKLIDNVIIPNKSDISNIVEINKTILSDKNPPELNVSIPERTKIPKLEIKGKVEDKETGVIEIKINNTPINFDISGSFSYTLNLSEGINLIKFEVLDRAGNKLTKTFSVNYSINIIKILLQIGNRIIYINDTPQEIDVAPQIIEGRTYLPIRYIAEPIGATVEWDGKEKKVTIKHKNTTIELWIGKSNARVSGVNTPIDSSNLKVTPLIISGRTMLPVRFVAENLGCQVDYDSKYKLITIIYELD